MTTEPEYPIIYTKDLKPGQQFRFWPSGRWYPAPASSEAWVEAKPAPFQVGDRVRYKDDAWPGEHYHTTATVKHVGESWLIVQVDDGDYEDAWAIRHTERIEDDHTRVPHHFFQRPERRPTVSSRPEPTVAHQVPRLGAAELGDLGGGQAIPDDPGG